MGPTKPELERLRYLKLWREPMNSGIRIDPKSFWLRSKYRRCINFAKELFISPYKNEPPRWSLRTWPVMLWQMTPSHEQHSSPLQDGRLVDGSTMPSLNLKRASLSSPLQRNFGGGLYPSPELNFVFAIIRKQRKRTECSCIIVCSWRIWKLWIIYNKNLMHFLFFNLF